MNSKSLLKSRIVWVDNVKYVCIICVIASHLESSTVLSKRFYLPFFLMAFFFVSGYVYKHKNGFKEFLYKKMRQLFVPWFVFSFFIVFLSHIVSFNSHEDLKTELFWNLIQVREVGDEVWFVAALFITYIPFYFFINYVEKKKESKRSNTNQIKIVSVAIIISFLLSFFSVLFTKLIDPGLFPWNNAVLPWHLEYVFQAMFFMVLGYFFKGVPETWFDAHNRINTKIIIGIVYLCLIYVPIGLSIYIPPAVDVIYTYISQILGVTLTISISKAIKPNQYILYIGQNTLICFALHGKLFSIVQVIFKKVVPDLYGMVLSNEVVSNVFSIVLAVALTIVLIIPIWFINKYFPFILGRKKNG